MTTSPHIFESLTLWTASLGTLSFRLGSRWKTARQKEREVSVDLFFSLNPCFLSIYLEMSSSSFRAHLHWVLVELFLTLILTFLSPSLWLILSLNTEGWCSILTNFLFFSHTLSCQWPLLSPDFNYHSYFNDSQISIHHVSFLSSNILKNFSQSWPTLSTCPPP